MRLARLLTLAVLTAVLVLAGQTTRAADDDKDFVKLFNGKDFTGLKFEIGKSDPTKTWSVAEGIIVCTGKPNGYFYTEKSYKNYHLKCDVRYAKPKDLTDDSKFGGNSGVLVHITGDHKVWPKCVEAQGMNKDMGNLFAIGGAKGSFKKEAEAQKKAIKPVGEWNAFEVISKDGELTEGTICWQSEGAEIHFQDIKIKDMK